MDTNILVYLRTAVPVPTDVCTPLNSGVKYYFIYHSKQFGARDCVANEILPKVARNMTVAALCVR